MSSTQHAGLRYARSEPGSGRRLHVLGEIVEVKLTAEDTGGAYSLYEVHSPAGSGVPALHTHPPQETFYVLEGEYQFWVATPDGPHAVRVGSGSVFHVPAGAPHGFENVGDGPARLLALFEPPGRMHELFEVLDGAHPDAEQLERIFEEHDVVMLPERD